LNFYPFTTKTEIETLLNNQILKITFTNVNLNYSFIDIQNKVLFEIKKIINEKNNDKYVQNYILNYVKNDIRIEDNNHNIFYGIKNYLKFLICEKISHV
jgi:disulfide oxidoreductase YuzD